MPHHALWFLPIAVTAMLIEALLYRRRLAKPYPWRDSGLSLIIAAGHNLSQLAGRALLGGVYAYAWNHRVFTMPLHGAAGVMGLFLSVEFLYYWEHRLSHTVRWLWATHAVHHSPNELTLATALRLGWTGPFSGGGLLYLPLVLVGVHPLAIFAMLALSLAYQFWLHTQMVPQLRGFDSIFNSPSNHRVHHACNPEYLDKNFGGVLIVFDRLFGTYGAEREIPCRYGLVTPQNSANPLVVAPHEWRRLLRDACRASGWRAVLLTLFGRPTAAAVAAPPNPIPPGISP
jgi:sterol desaturase/sphingolipid hydroxylase (fatty acid hydroxylase superfamily)